MGIFGLGLSNKRHHHCYRQQSHRGNQYVVAPAGNHSKHAQSPANKSQDTCDLGKVAVSLHQYGRNSLHFNLGRGDRIDIFAAKNGAFIASSEQFSAPS
jgi:hypothetical protein